MKKYSEMTREELLLEKESTEKRYSEKKALGLKLDISRGKPCPEQLALSLPMLDLVNSKPKISNVKTVLISEITALLTEFPNAAAFSAKFSMHQWKT